jgi:hypothetical protein
LFLALFPLNRGAAVLRLTELHEQGTHMAINRSDRTISGPSGDPPRGSAASSATSAAASTSSTQQASAQSAASEGGIAQKLRSQAAERLVDQKNRAIGELDTIADAIRGTGRQLRDNQHVAVASYVEGAADQLHRFSQTLQNKEVGEIVEEVQRFGRSRPALFVGLAFGAGLIGARFLKSSSDSYESRTGEYGTPPRPASDWRQASSAPIYGGTRGSTGPNPPGPGGGPADLG